MSTKTILICGLPASGKTTFLAALSYLVRFGGTSTALTHNGLAAEREYINMLAECWSSCQTFERTKLGQEKDVTLHLKAGDRPIELTVPDLSGEAWEQIWAKRCCDQQFVDLCQNASAVMLFVHVDDIRPPISVTDAAAMENAVSDSSDIGDEENASDNDGFADENVKVWQPDRDCPTQAIVVDLLQMLVRPPLTTGPRRLAVILSAWDCISDERTPDTVLVEELPLLSQYLHSGLEYREWKVFGVSAQGGPINTPEDMEHLLSISAPADRIQVVHSDHPSHDLSRILSWLLDG